MAVGQYLLHLHGICVFVHMPCCHSHGCMKPFEAILLKYHSEWESEVDKKTISRFASVCLNELSPNCSRSGVTPTTSAVYWGADEGPRYESVKRELIK